MSGSIRIAMSEDNKTIVTLNGVLDQELAANLIAIVPKVSPPIILNLQQVPHLTVAGSGAILNFYQQHLNKPEIRGANPDVVSLLQLTGASAYIELPDA